MSPALRLDRHLCFWLYSASRAMTQAYGPLLERLGLTYPQYLVMLVLWEEDGLGVSEVGARLALDSGTLTPLLKRLEAARLVKRTRDPRDQRIVRASLTPKGRSLEARAAGVPAELACKVELSPGKLEALREQLRLLTGRLSAERAPAAPRSRRSAL